MSGYVIADVTVTDPETYADYRALTPGSIAAFDGRFLVTRRRARGDRGRLEAGAAGAAAVRQPRACRSLVRFAGLC